MSTMVNGVSKEPVVEWVRLEHLHEWARNPRGGMLRGIEEFAAQLMLEGVREDLHVFRLNGALTIMQGHRRFAAARWIETSRPGSFEQGLRCKVYEFTEEEAFEHLLTLQNGADPFDSRELALAARTAVLMGIDVARLPGVFHRSVETVQLYLDLGKLPQRAQEAVYGEKLTLGTAGRLLKLQDEAGAEVVEEATLFVMNNTITGEPMSEEQARIFLENRYFAPLRQEKAWVRQAEKLKRGPHRVADGFSYVDWAQRDQFVMEGALPQTAFVKAGEHIKDEDLVDPGKPVTWGALAEALGVPIFVCAAPAVAEKYLLLVKMSAVRDADSVSEVPRLLKRGTGRVKGSKEEERPAPVAEEEEKELADVVEAYREFYRSVPGCKESDLQAEFNISFEAAQALLKVLRQEEVQGAVSEEAEEVSEFPTEDWRKVLAKLLSRPDAVMQDGLWKALADPLLGLVRQQVGAEVWRMIELEHEADGCARRAGLRWVFLGSLAWVLESLEDPEELMVELRRVLGE